MTLKIIANNVHRQFFLVDEMGRTWAVPYTAQPQDTHPGWDTPAPNVEDIWLSVTTPPERNRVAFIIAAVDACQGLTMEQLRQRAQRTTPDGLIPPEQFDAVGDLIRSRGPAREAARMVLVDGWSTSEAAAANGLTSQSVSNALRRYRTAHKKLCDAYSV